MTASLNYGAQPCCCGDCAEAGGKADEPRIEAVEDRAARLVGYSLFVLAAHVVFNSAYGLFFAHLVTDPHESVWGIAVGLVAKIGMPILAGYKLKVAARLKSKALRADAMEAITCGYLSIVLMVGLSATRAAISGGCDRCGSETRSKGTIE